MKKIGLILLILVVLFALVSAFLPGKIHVERSIMIQAPVKTVFNQVNTLTNWKNWSYWDNIDPNMKSEFEGPQSGTGAIHKWTSNNDSVGNGSLTIVESTEPSSITTSLHFEDWGTSMGGWTFEETDQGVKTSLYMDVEMPFFGRIIPGLMMDKWMGKDFDKTLNNLKSYSESLPNTPEMSWNVDIVTTNPTHSMSIMVTSGSSEISSKLGESYGKIMEEMAKQGLQQAGPVYTIYHKYSKEQVDMEPGIPVDKPGKSESGVAANELKAMKAMKIDYYGDYSRMEGAYNFMQNWAKEHNTTFTGPPWEEYITDPSNEPDTSKWLTRIYFPIQ